MLPAGWAWLEDGQLDGLVPGQVAAAAASGDVALVVRAESVEPWINRVDPMTARQVGGADGVVTGDFLLSEQHDRASEITQTLYQGPTTQPGVARWVYYSGERVWWRVSWRSDDQLEQVLAWAPRTELDALARDMSALEAASSFETPPFRMVGGRCDESRTLDRRALVEASVRRSDARAEGVAEQLAVDGIVTRAVEICLTSVLPRTGACRAVEGTPSTPADHDLASEVLRCVDGRERLPIRIQERLDEVRAW